MNINRKLQFIWATTTMSMPDEFDDDDAEEGVPLAPNRRYVAACTPNDNEDSWCVFDRFEERFLTKKEIRRLPPHALTQEIAVC